MSNGKIKKIGVLTSGGDSQGMNAAVRAVVRHGIANGLEVYGIYEGYKGLVDGGEKIRKFTAADVANIVGRGGTTIYSARLVGFREEWAMQQGIRNARELGIDGLVTIGGDGTFRGAYDLCMRGFPCIGIPGSIDNDITCTDRTIGFDTATNITVRCIDSLRDTDESHMRCNVIEAMGRNAGYIALYAGIACGATGIVIKEDLGYSEDSLLEKIRAARLHGKRNIMVVVSEGVEGYSEKLAGTIQEKTGIETKFARLAHIVRGGSPTAEDRLLATRMGTAAVDMLIAGEQNKFVCLRDNRIVGVDIQYAIMNDNLYKARFTPAVRAKLTDESKSRFSKEQLDEMEALCDLRENEIKDLLRIADTTSTY
ncbi:MAG: 6-phosphofructokinase [Clostridia bacterium]|nr:6-phosphofructokinase [Clostridia bacterium]